MAHQEEPQSKDEIIQDLKRLALEEGLAKAVKEAKEYEDPYIVDELHDALADELKKRLLEEGEIEEL